MVPSEKPTERLVDRHQKPSILFNTANDIPAAAAAPGSRFKFVAAGFEGIPAVDGMVVGRIPSYPSFGNNCKGLYIITRLLSWATATATSTTTAPATEMLGKAGRVSLQ